MKQTNKIAFITLGVVFAGLLMVGCNKSSIEDNAEIPRTKKSESADLAYVVDEDVDPALVVYTPRLKQMVESIEAGQDYDDLDGLDYDSTEFYIEGALNYKYGDAGLHYETTEMIEFDRAITLSSEETSSFQEMASEFSAISQNVVEFYNSFEGDKTIFMIDLEMKSGEKGSVRKYVVRVFLKRGDLIGTTAAEADDDYRHGNNTGKCDGTPDKGASQIIEDKVNYNMGVLGALPSAKPGYRVYSIDISRTKPYFWFNFNVSPSPSTDPNVAPGNIYASKDDGTGIPPCMTKALINYYIAQAPPIVYSVIPSGKTYRSFWNKRGYESKPSDDDDYEAWEDNYQVWNAKNQVTTDPNAL